MRPFDVRRFADVIELVLDTPNASVNVFGPPAAAQLAELLSSPPRDATTLVIRSAKPGSFVNGAGLLYANTMRSIEGALSLSEPVRDVYEMLASSRLRTVASIEGNCFGCGLELALACDVRIARDTVETELRMTEVTDYRFVPLFGGTWRLPRRIGGEAAAKLLLDGERWNARHALARGLVDHVLPPAASERAHAAAIRDARARRPRGERAEIVRREVPPTRVALWRTVEDLIARAHEGSTEACRRREVQAFARTVTGAAAKNAMAFFYVRHAARAASFGTAERVVPEVRLRVGTRGGTARARAAWRRHLDAPCSLAPRRDVTLAVVSDRGALASDVALAFPGGLAGGTCEISAQPADLERARQIGHALVWRGVEVVITLGAGHHVSSLLLERTRDALEHLVRSGSSAAIINGALWDAGFEHPLRCVRAWPRERGPGPPEPVRDGILSALAAAWHHALDQAISRRWLMHRSQGDVLVHALFGFPVELGSFARWFAGRSATHAPAAMQWSVFRLGTFHPR